MHLFYVYFSKEDRTVLGHFICWSQW